MANTFLPWEQEKKKKTFLPWEAEDVVETEEEETGDGWWETTKDVASDVGGGMLGAVHQLGRLQSGVAGGLFNIQEELMMGDQPEDDRSSWERYVNETIEGMKKGVTYKDEKRFQDLMAQANPEWVASHPILSTVIGFGGDVLTDPLMYIPFGQVAVGARVLGKLIEGTSVGKKLIDVADNPVLRGINVYTGGQEES